MFTLVIRCELSAMEIIYIEMNCLLQNINHGMIVNIERMMSIAADYTGQRVYVIH